MSDGTERRDRGSLRPTWFSAWVTTALVLGACTLVPWLFMALERDDVEASESPLVLAVARQLTHGPRELYGPFGGGNPLVLIHPPLYYRLAALGAWPLARAGFGLSSGTHRRPDDLARRMGGDARRGVFPGSLSGCAADRRMVGRASGRGDAGLRRPAVEVRPDMLGVAIQTWGVVLLLGALQAERPSERARSCLPSPASALAGCVKQQLAVAPGVSTFLLASACRARRVRFGTIAGALLFDAFGAFRVLRLREWDDARADRSCGIPRRRGLAR